MHNTTSKFMAVLDVLWTCSYTGCARVASAHSIWASLSFPDFRSVTFGILHIVQPYLGSAECE